MGTTDRESTILGNLSAVAEAYPDLKTSPVTNLTDGVNSVEDETTGQKCA